MRVENRELDGSVFQGVNLPKLPACVVLDSRFSSQQRVRFDLSKSALFQKIQVAPALEEGLSMVRNGTVDVCIIGPSVTLQAATRFLIHANKVPKRRCALVAFANKPGSARALQMSGADAVVDSNYSEEGLSKTVITAVVKVRPDSVWTPYWEILKERERALRGPQGLKHSEQSVLSRVFRESAESLQRISLGIREGIYGYDEDKALSQLTKTALHQIVENALADKDPHISKSLAPFMSSALELWVSDTLELGESMAKVRLRNRLLCWGGVEPA